jgi:hypothetical protein
MEKQSSVVAGVPPALIGLQPTRLPLQKANQQSGGRIGRCADSRKLSGQRGIPAGPRRN